METPTYETPNMGGMRSTFLTVICVLTFIGSGWGVIKGVREYVMADKVAAMASASMEKLQDKMDAQDSPGFAKGLFNSVAQNMNAPTIRESAIFQFIASLLTLCGAIMMWNLNKNGFYLYIAGTVILIAAPLIIMGTGMVGIISAATTAFVGVAFIAMYGANLKDMRA